MGGRDAFIGKLDSLFTADSKLEGESTSVDISGLIGQYAHGNEPSHHIAHLYNYVGQPWRTQEIVDEVLHTLYFNNPDGLSGNEDCGQMSASGMPRQAGIFHRTPAVQRGDRSSERRQVVQGDSPQQQPRQQVCAEHCAERQ